jgi:hypothetical protein
MVCQPLATVVVASVSQERVGSAASSTFRRTGIPAVGDHTRTVIVLAAAVKGMIAIELFAPVETVVSAHSSATADSPLC